MFFIDLNDIEFHKIKKNLYNLTIYKYDKSYILKPNLNMFYGLLNRG